jgi:tRNA dimethylallyltransferase
VSTRARPVAVVAGPTASGKSALALDLALALDGVVVNADSMQLYRELRIVTARPTPADEAAAPHRLYGVLPAAERGSAARWLALALAEIRAAHAAGRLPVVVGGTGLYLRLLTEGPPTVPAVPADVRASVEAAAARDGVPALHARLASHDPATAARLSPNDRTRVLRALEVLEATGRPPSAWRAEAGAGPPPDMDFRTLVLLPPRDALYAACDARFGRMVAEGALDEVRDLLALGLRPDLPAMKAVGVPELAAAVRGQASLAEAVERGRRATRNYAKRQTTWFRHQTSPARVAGVTMLQNVPRSGTDAFRRLAASVARCQTDETS